MSKTRAEITRAFLAALGDGPGWLSDTTEAAGLTPDEGCDVLKRGLDSGHLRLVGNGNQIERVR